MAKKPFAQRLISKQAEREKKQIEGEVKKFEDEYRALCAKHGYIFVAQLASNHSQIAAVLRIGRLSEEDIEAYNKANQTKEVVK